MRGAGRGLILTYHAVQDGPPPLCLSPARFREHLDRLVDAGAQTMTISELAQALSRRRLPDRTVAITFDDGAASVARTAAPLLLERGLRATVFCVAGHVGGHNDWATEPTRSPALRLVDAGELAELARAGFEIGSHGVTHRPLDRGTPEDLRREICDSRVRLEDLAGAPVRSLAFPYAIAPAGEGRDLVRRHYAAACAGGNTRLEIGASPFALPRIDIHYLRRPALLQRAVAGSGDVYLGARRLGARARRLVVSDHS